MHGRRRHAYLFSAPDHKWAELSQGIVIHMHHTTFCPICQVLSGNSLEKKEDFLEKRGFFRYVAYFCRLFMRTMHNSQMLEHADPSWQFRALPDIMSRLIAPKFAQKKKKSTDAFGAFW